MQSEKFTLYGVQLSWYSAKIRPYLKYKGIEFVEKAPSLLTYYGRIKWHCGDKTMPVAVTPGGEWIADSSVIVERMEARFPSASVIPASPVQKFAAYLLEMWGDEFWHPPALHYRFSFPEHYPKWMAEMCQALLPGLPTWLQRYAAALPFRMMLAYTKLIGVVPDQIPAIERWTVQQLDALDAHFATLPYLLGTCPSLADYAVLGPVVGHLVHDAVPFRTLIEPRKHLHSWIQRMNKPQGQVGSFIDGDTVPEGLNPIFRSVFDEMLPLIEGTLCELEKLIPRMKSGEKFPRFVGPIDVPYSGGTYRRVSLTYVLWMAQGVLDVVRHMSKDDAQKVHQWLRAVGGERLLDLKIPRLRLIGLHVAPA